MKYHQVLLTYSNLQNYNLTGEPFEDVIVHSSPMWILHCITSETNENFFYLRDELFLEAIFTKKIKTEC